VGKLKKMIPGVIMTKRIIEPDIPRHIKIKRSCLTSPGTGRDIKTEREMLQNTLADSIFCGSEKVLTKPIVTI
jgi:hypothetical protein